ncbi:unnamed protein product, partial [Brassica oleracea var. botrytis]
MIVGVFQQNGWSFVPCTGCNRKLEKTGTSLLHLCFFQHHRRSQMPSGGFQDASTLSSIYVSLNTITTSTIIPSPSTQSEKMSSLALNHRLAASTKLQDATSKLGYVQHLLATKLMRPAKELGMMNQIQRAWKRKETV